MTKQYGSLEDRVAKHLFGREQEEVHWPDAQVVQVYKTFVEMADRVSSRRQAANNFYLSTNTILVGITFAGQSELMSGRVPVFVLAIAGVVICLMWQRSVRSYKQLNSGKFAVITELEKRFPVRAYTAEWEGLRRGEDSEQYREFAGIESVVPFVFGLLYVVAAGMELFSYFFD